jgi:hypothetical protein
MIFSKKFHFFLLAVLIATQVPVRCAHDDNNSWDVKTVGTSIGVVVVIIGLAIINAFVDMQATPPQKPALKTSTADQEKRDLEKAKKASLEDQKKWQEKHAGETQTDQNIKKQQQALLESWQSAKGKKEGARDQHDRAYPVMASAPDYKDVYPQGNVKPSAPSFADVHGHTPAG